MVAGKCGGGCGPIVVRPDLTVEPGPDHEFEVLCDDQGAFLRRYTVDGGVVTTVDTELDGVTGYSPSGEVRTCTDGGSEESPGEPPQVGGPQAVVLRDAEGVSFVRTYQLTADGQITGYVDTTLGGESYVPADPVGVCPPGGDESAPEPCGDTEVLLLCDTDGDNRTQFLRHITTGCDGTVTSVSDTKLDATTPYTPQGEVKACEPEPPSPVVATGGQRIQPDGGQEVVDVTGSVGRLLSATVTVIAGEATVTTDSGSLPIPAGASLTWGTSGPGQQLSTLVVTVPDGGDTLVHYTHQDQAGQVTPA